MFVLNKLQFNQIFRKLIKSLPEKHINRRKNEEDNEWEHLSSVGEKIDTSDALDVTDRAITFKNEFGVPLTNYELYEEERDRVQDQVGNTAQYIKFVNESIKEKRNKMDRIQELQRRFQADIDSLQGKEKSKDELDKIRYQEIKACDIMQTLSHMERERHAIKKKMDYHAQQVSRSQLDLLEKDKDIASVKAELDLLKKKESVEVDLIENSEDPLRDLKNKLDKIGDEKEKEMILKNLKSLVNRLNQDEKGQNSLKSNYIR